MKRSVVLRWVMRLVLRWLAGRGPARVTMGRDEYAEAWRGADELAVWKAQRALALRFREELIVRAVSATDPNETYKALGGLAVLDDFMDEQDARVAAAKLTCEVAK